MSKNLDWFDYHNKNFTKEQMEHYYKLYDELTSMESLLKIAKEAEDYDDLVVLQIKIDEFEREREKKDNE